MGGNPEYCLSVEEWKARFLAWIREPTPQALLGANIVFDFRALHGDTALADSLREWLLGYTQANAAFLRLMLSAKGRDVEVSKGLAVGADAYVTKPFSTRDLIAKVAELLGE